MSQSGPGLWCRRRRDTFLTENVFQIYRIKLPAFPAAIGLHLLTNKLSMRDERQPNIRLRV
jgi:hypothetical protein